MIALVLGLTGGVALSGCSPTYTQNIEVTVSVDDHGTIRTGSSVFKFVCQETNRSLGQMGLGKCLVYGEAVAVDLKSKGYLIMPISGNQRLSPEEFVFATTAGSSGGQEVWSIDPTRVMFIRFSNSLAPNTVRVVDAQNLSESYGMGVSSLNITAKTVSVEPTFGKISNVLPWLESTKGLISGEGIITSNDLYHNLTRVNFISGDKK